MLAGLCEGESAKYRPRGIGGLRRWHQRGTSVALLVALLVALPVCEEFRALAERAQAQCSGVSRRLRFVVRSVERSIPQTEQRRSHASDTKRGNRSNGPHKWRRECVENLLGRPVPRSFAGQALYPRWRRGEDRSGHSAGAGGRLECCKDMQRNIRPLIFLRS